MVSTLEIIEQIEEEDWKYLLSGLQEHFVVTQFGLLNKIGIKENNISCWMNGKANVPLNHKGKIVEFMLVKSLDIDKIIKFGKLIEKGTKFDGEWISGETALINSDFEKHLVIKKNKSFYLNVPKFFPDSRKGNILYFLPYQDKLIIFYNGRGNSRPYPLCLPHYLKLDKTFLVGLGIYLAEGARNRRAKVTNSEPLVIDQGIDFFELIGIKKSKLRAWLQLHERSIKSLEEAKNFWIKNTKLSKNNITKLRFKKSTGNAKVKQFGVLHLETTTILPQLLVNNLLSYISSILKLLPQRELIYFLQGAFAGEGSVNITKTGTVNMVRYTSTNIEERNMIKNILNKLRLNVHESNTKSNARHDISVMGFFDIKKMFEIDIFRYHPLRKQKLLEGFSKLRKKGNIPEFNKRKIISLLCREGFLSVYDIKKRIGLNYSNVKKHLRELYYVNKVKKIEGKGSIPNKWFI